MFSAPAGLRRLPYFFISLVISIGLSFITGYVLHLNDYLSMAINYVAVLPFVYLRITNIGANPLWSLLSLIPFINLIVLVPAYAFPENFAQTKKLDTPAIILLCLPFGAAFLSILIIIAVTLIGGNLNTTFSKVGSSLPQTQQQPQIRIIHIH